MKRLLSILITLGTELLPFLKLDDRGYRFAGLIVLLVNLVPLFGIFFLDWHVWLVIMVYWAESAVIGVINIVKMLLAGYFSEMPVVGLIGALFLSAFFSFHYGMFMFVHGIFLIFFGSEFFHLFNEPDLSGFKEIFTPVVNILIEDYQSTENLFDLLDTEIVALVLIVGSHIVSFIINYIRKRVFQRASFMKFFTTPYRRIIVMHLTIILGAFLFLSSMDSRLVIVIWVALKIIADLRGYYWEQKAEKRAAEFNIL